MAIMRRAVSRLNSSSSVLLVCDIQERFKDIVCDFSSIVASARHLLSVSKVLKVPSLVTEQYPAAFGHTVKELQAEVAGVPVMEKKQFSMCTEPLMEKLKEFKDRQQVVLCGIEAHVCVQQTCSELLEKGYEVHIVVDGISSQRRSDLNVALHHMASEGATLTTAESLVFQWLRSADHPQFKELLALNGKFRQVAGSDDFWSSSVLHRSYDKIRDEV